MALKLYTNYRLGGIPKHYVSDEEDNMLIPDEVRKSVVFLLYVNKKQQLNLAGTGFFVSVQPDEFDGRTFVYLITAKHVIVAVRQHSIDGNIIVRINDRNGGQQTIAVHESVWKEHPTDSSVDISVLNWAPKEDVFDYLTLPETMLATDEIIKRESIGLGDEVFITGLFVSHFGKARNIPIVRVGNIASMPEEKVDTSTFGSIEAYLIEARSIGGLSGSPVFVNLSGIRGNQIRNNVLYLLGLIHGHWDTQEKAIDGLKEDNSGGNVNMGIAIVVPSTKILEVINQPIFAEIRKNVMNDYKKAKMPVEDTPAQDSVAANEQNLEGITKEEFEDALKKIARPLKKDDQVKKET